MKLTFNNCTSQMLYEADVNQGRRVKYITDIYNKLEPVVSSANYKFKAASDVTKGFFILPKFKHLINFTFEMDDEGNLAAYVADATVDAANKDNAIPSIPFRGVSEADLDKVTAPLIEAMSKACEMFLIKDGNLAEALSENKEQILEFANPFKAIANGIKNVAAKISNSADAHAAKVADKKDAAQLLKDDETKLTSFTDNLANNLKTIAPGFVISNKVSGRVATVTVSSSNKVILGITLKPYASSGSETLLQAVQILTGDGKSKNISMSLDELLELIGKKLNIDMSGVIKAAEAATDASTDAEDEDSTDSEDSKDSDEVDATEDDKEEESAATAAKTSYEIDTIIAGLTDESSIDAAEVIKLLGESISGKKHMTITEAAVNLNGVKPANYLQVYNAIASNKDAVTGLVKRFIHQGLKVPEAQVDKIDSKNLQVYSDEILEAQFNTSSQINPAAYVLSLYLAKWKQLPTQLTQGVVRYFSKNSNTRAAILDIVKVDPKSAKFNSIDNVFVSPDDAGSESCILYCRELNKKSNVDIIIKNWYNARSKNMISIITSIMGNDETRSNLAEICGVDAEALSVDAIGDAYKALFLKSIDGSDFADSSVISNRIEALKKIDIKGAASASKNSETDDSEEEEAIDFENEDLTIDELKDLVNAEDSEISMKSFMKNLDKILKDKGLTVEAARDLQKKILALV